MSTKLPIIVVQLYKILLNVGKMRYKTKSHIMGYRKLIMWRFYVLGFAFNLLCN